MSDLTETDFPSLEPQPFVTEEGREIERLRAELAAMRQQRDEACQRTYNAGFVEASRIHGIEIQQLRKQRDEARRDACIFEVIADFNKKYPTGCMTSELAMRLARIVADEREWDCFAQQEGGGA